ncbi:MAG: hypothetical protein ABFS45_23910 [Pseudomonadota bacterium]
MTTIEYIKDVMMSDENKPYSGPERRKGERRKKRDRRDMIRFELDKELRRSKKDRRKKNKDLWDGRDGV